MDDFGIGYSTLASLHRFPLDIMKVNSSFIHRLDNNRPYAAMVHAIITLAHNLELKVVAEGVETNEQLVVLQALECNEAQGDYFSPPLGARDAEEFICSYKLKHVAAAATAAA
jgi:EAL domain-containing protein (putative c-di-GMP-specific phosphodiesterase class I)